MTRCKLIPIYIILALSACSRPQSAVSEKLPEVCPDYIGVTVPRNLPLPEFTLEGWDRADARIETFPDSIVVTMTGRATRHPKASETYAATPKADTTYRPFTIYLSSDEIDPYIAYRLIEPGYESWHDITICQRELSSFRERIIVSNNINDRGCINCHTFDGGDPSRMIFHARGPKGGTIILDGGDKTLLNLKQVGPGKQGVYPAWHPEGRYVAFSSNKTQQNFHIIDSQPIEVFDRESDLILLDLETMEVTSIAAADGPEQMETFPTWSPDGTRLYFCSADPVGNVEAQRGEIRYRIMSLGFEDGRFIGEPRLEWACDSLSASFPRISGETLLFTAAAYGTFPIWHREADLYAMDLISREVRRVDELNSEDTESYHSWSSNGRWVVFSSRRGDGRYTRLFLAHHRGDGRFDKPFALPQKHASDDQMRLKSYNIPEFMNAPARNRDKEASELFR